MKTLKLTLHKKWFDKILSGRKRWEFREVKPYWTSRIENRQYDAIEFTNGYGHHRPRIVVTYLSYTVRTVKNKKLYALALGKLLR